MSNPKEKSNPLQEVIRCLSIQDVYLRGTRINLQDSFDPTTPDIPVTILFKIEPKIGQEIELKNNQSNVKIMRFFIGTGVRFVSPDEGDKQQIYAEIESEFIADYAMKEGGFSEDSLKQFANQNAIYHVWPYLREYVQSTCQRFRLPPIVMPMFQVSAENRPRSD